MGGLVMALKLQFSFGVALPCLISDFNDNKMYANNLSACKFFSTIDYFSSLIMSTLLHPAEVIESRLIIQNRIKEFSSIRNVFQKISGLFIRAKLAKDLGKVYFLMTNRGFQPYFQSQF